MTNKTEALLQAKSELIYNKINKTNDFLSILAIVQLLLTLFKLYVDCNYNQKQTESLLKSPNLLQRAIIRKVVDRSFPNEFYANQIYQRLLEVNSKATAPEIEIVMEK